MRASDQREPRPSISPPELQPGQRSQIVVADVHTGEQTVVYETTEILLEAPNWSLDGRSLVLNGDFELWCLELGSGQLRHIAMEGVPLINNDHVLDPTARMSSSRHSTGTSTACHWRAGAER